MKSLKFHHHGLAVRNPTPAQEWLVTLGYDFTEIVYDPLQFVYVQLAKREDTPTVELIWSDKENSPLKHWLQSSPTMIYHTCYEVDNIAETVGYLRSQGKAIPIGRPQPAVLFEGRFIQFVHLKGFGLIELVELLPRKK